MITDPKLEGYRLPECIYDENLSAQSSLAITNLDGDHDYEYVIEIRGAITITSAPTLTTTLSAAWQGVINTWNDQNTSTLFDGDASGQPKLGEGFKGSGNVNQVDIEVTLKASKGLERTLRSDCSIRNADGMVHAIANSHHATDTTTNITNFTIVFGGSFTGNVTIYRVLKK